MSKIAPVIVAASLLVALAAIVIFTARGCDQPPPLPHCTPALACRGLVKRYGSTTAVAGSG